MLQLHFLNPYYKDKLFHIFHMPLTVMVYAPPSNRITSLTSLWLLRDILWKLSNIPTEVTRGKSGCQLLTLNHKMFHSFSALIQPTHFRSTPSDLIFEINSWNSSTDIWARWWDSSAGYQMLRLAISWKITFDILYHWTWWKYIVPCCDNQRKYLQRGIFKNY